MDEITQSTDATEAQMKHPGVGTPRLTCVAVFVASSAPNRRSRGRGGARSGLAGARREQARETAQDGRRGSRADEGGGASAAAVRRRDAMGGRAEEGELDGAERGRGGGFCLLVLSGCGRSEQQDTHGISPSRLGWMGGWVDRSTRPGRTTVFSGSRRTTTAAGPYPGVLHLNLYCLKKP